MKKFLSVILTTFLSFECFAFLPSGSDGSYNYNPMKGAVAINVTQEYSLHVISKPDSVKGFGFYVYDPGLGTAGPLQNLNFDANGNASMGVLNESSSIAFWYEDANGNIIYTDPMNRPTSSDPLDVYGYNDETNKKDPLFNLGNDSGGIKFEIGTSKVPVPAGQPLPGVLTSVVFAMIGMGFYIKMRKKGSSSFNK